MRMRSKKKTTRSKKATGARTMGSWALGLAVCIVATAVLLAARQPSKPATITMAKAQAGVAPVQAKATPATQAKATPATRTPATESVSKAVVQKSAAATISGCLDRDNETFRLKDTTGSALPRSRSWKTGFIKKGTPSIEVVDAGHGLSLPTHVGHRVSLSGTLADREMRARSLRRVAGSCA